MPLDGYPWLVDRDAFKALDIYGWDEVNKDGIKPVGCVALSGFYQEM